MEYNGKCADYVVLHMFWSIQRQLGKINENIGATEHTRTCLCLYEIMRLILSVTKGGRGLDHYGSGFGDVTRGSALAHRTSWSSGSPTGKKLETSVEHGVGRCRCLRSPSENSSQGHGVPLSGLGATSEACLWIFCCVSPSSWALTSAEERGKVQSGVDSQCFVAGHV